MTAADGHAGAGRRGGAAPSVRDDPQGHRAAGQREGLDAETPDHAGDRSKPQEGQNTQLY